VDDRASHCDDDVHGNSINAVISSEVFVREISVLKLLTTMHDTSVVSERHKWEVGRVVGLEAVHEAGVGQLIARDVSLHC
jgi:hypothetical protein